MTTKDELTKGTVVRLTVDPLAINAIASHLDGRMARAIGSADLRRDTYVVKDLFARRNFNKPNEVGIGPSDRGVAFGVTLDQIELV